MKRAMRKLFLFSFTLLIAGCGLLARHGPPYVRSLKTNYGEQPSVGRGKEVVLTISARDLENNELEFTWTAVPLSGATRSGGTFRNPRVPAISPQDTLIGVFQDTISVFWKAPFIPDTYLLRLWITNGREITADSLVVRVTQRPPVANAGRDQRIRYIDGGTIALDGTKSSDPDDDDLTYFWTQISGPNVALTNDRTARPVFRPPAAGDYRFRLRVFDGADSSNVSVVVIHLSDRGDV